MEEDAEARLEVTDAESIEDELETETDARVSFELTVVCIEVEIDVMVTLFALLVVEADEVNAV